MASVLFVQPSLNTKHWKSQFFGASGATGHHLVKEALAQGHSVTAFVRNALRLKIKHPRLKIIEGDIANFNLVAEATRDKDAVLSALGAASPFKYDKRW